MSLFSYEMNESEKKIKKHWLLSTICLMVGYPLLLLVVATVCLVIEPGLVNELKKIFLTLTLALFIGLFSIWISWHCAYKKYGNRFLLFSVISPAREMRNQVIQIFKPDVNGLEASCLILWVVLSIWWLWLSYKLYKLNKAIQERVLVNPDQVTT